MEKVKHSTAFGKDPEAAIKEYVRKRKAAFEKDKQHYLSKLACKAVDQTE